jgi:hypothetical protein
MDQKACKMQCWVAATAHMCHVVDSLAELEQPAPAPVLAALHQEQPSRVRASRG